MGCEPHRPRGRDRQHRTQRGGEVSDQFVFTVRPDSFGAKPHWRSSESWPGSRLLPRSWPGEASRPLVLLWARTIPPRLSRQFPRRRNATKAFRVGACRTSPTEADGGSGVERSESWRVRPESGFPTRARAEQCRRLARREWVRRLRLSPSKRKCRLCEATG